MNIILLHGQAVAGKNAKVEQKVLRGCEINKSGPREWGLGRMARRERGVYPQARPPAVPHYSLPPPQRSVIPQLRDRQNPQSSLLARPPTAAIPSACSALRVASLFGLCGVARQSQISANMLPPRVLHRPKNQQQRDPLLFISRPPRIFAAKKYGGLFNGLGKRTACPQGPAESEKCKSADPFFARSDSIFDSAEKPIDAIFRGIESPYPHRDRAIAGICER
jgi:hypothetical protein